MTTPGPAGLICLGASAGGLRSLEAIVSKLGADLPWPVLISQHLQADRVSQMPEILARIARMPVREAEAGETPAAGTIYTCPSSHELGVALDGTLTLREPAAGRPQRIDHLFATASYARPGRTVAVVLSGTGSDGAVGSLVVKLNGGSVVAESDETAQHFAMPAAAQRAGTVDATLRAEAIAPLLYALAQHRLEETTAATRALVAQIARDITHDDGADFARYREGTLRRQAEKRRILLGLATLSQYRDLIARDEHEREAFVRGLLIPVTEFFRDPPAWRALEDEVIPRLAERARAGEDVRVWCVGCATGEEAYTVAILLSESIPDRHRVRVLGTDLDAGAMAAAARGTYDAARMRGVDELRRDRFFETAGQGYRVSGELRKMVQFRVHDATRDGPPGQFDLIICRNLLIYFDEALQTQTLGMLRGALSGPRVLFLGRSEAVGDPHQGFTPLVRAMRIFRASGDEDDAGERVDVELVAPTRPSRAASWSAADARLEEPDAIVLLLDEAGRVSRTNENARTLLGDGLEGTQLFDLFPRWQGSPVHDALRACLATGRSLKVRSAPSPAGPLDVTLESALGPARGALLIAMPAATRQRPEVPLSEMREDLAATNDELQTANEELAATNEELQATNEELASLNEEFQSTNQTLASTNVELGAVAKNTQTVTDLLNEFLQTWQDAIVACDGSQRISVFNRRAAQLFGLEDSSIGRPIELAPLGAAPSDILGWLERARETPVKQAVMHGGGEHELGVTHVKTPTGSPLGWVLSWTPR